MCTGSPEPNSLRQEVKDLIQLEGDFKTVASHVADPRGKMGSWRRMFYFSPMGVQPGDKVPRNSGVFTGDGFWGKQTGEKAALYGDLTVFGNEPFGDTRRGGPQWG